MNSVLVSLISNLLVRSQERIAEMQDWMVEKAESSEEMEPGLTLPYTSIVLRMNGKMVCAQLLSKTVICQLGYIKIVKMSV